MYKKISKVKNPHITQVVTKFVVSTTLDNKFRDLSVEHWKSLSGFSDHINTHNIAPTVPIAVSYTHLTLPTTD